MIAGWPRSALRCLALPLVATPLGADEGAILATSSWAVVPFFALLLAIAALPLIATAFWHRWYHAIAVGLAACTAASYFITVGHAWPLLHVAGEYATFIAMIASLYLCSAGVVIRVGRGGTATANAILLLIGAVIANLIGTTGASMVLIRPYMRMNRGRLRPYHIVFFIFIVANVGGALTPIGDPPLLLGFLRGIDFLRFLELNVLPWLTALALLLGIFWIIDRGNRDEALVETPATDRRGWLAIRGWRSVGFLALALGAVFIDPLRFSWVPALTIQGHDHSVVREALLVAIGIAAYRATPAADLAANGFSFAPLREVAWLFIGIFVTMLPALEIIRAQAQSGILFAMPLTPLTYYLGTGACSALLDNAPTFVAFLAGLEGQSGLTATAIGRSADPAIALSLGAIAVGSVFWGALTYIGNGPNLMIRAIAASAVDAAGRPLVAVPGFFAYLVRYALPILLPVLLIIGAVFYAR